MSKMGRLNLILTEQANELGYERIEDAVADGYDIVGEELLKTADKVLQEEKDEQLDKLDGVIEYLKGDKDTDVAGFMIRELEDVEKYIKERS